MAAASTNFAADLGFRRTQDHARLFLALGLRLARHGVLQRHRNGDVADFDRAHRDAPFGDLLADGVAQMRHPRSSRSDSSVASIEAPMVSRKRGLRHAVDGLAVIGDVERRLLRVVHPPENDRIHIDRHGVAGQRLLGVESAVVWMRWSIIAVTASTTGMIMNRPGPLTLCNLPSAQDDEFFPLVGHLQRQSR